MLEPRSFDVHKNATVLMIAMLDHLEIDIEILSVSMETMESDDCREILEDNGNVNRMLAMT